MGTSQALEGWHGLGALRRGVRQTHDDDLVELRSLRERYLRQLEYYHDIPGGECPPSHPNPAQTEALEAAWHACRVAYGVWEEAFARWQRLRDGA